MPRRLLTCGESAVLVEVDGLEEVLALNEAILAAREAAEEPFADVVDVVPAARTVLVVVRDGADLTAVRRALVALPTLPTLTSDVGDVSGGTRAGGPAGRASVVEIAVTYDGPDLDEVAHLTGLAPDEVVAAHTATPWRVGFAGFAPGFAYLSGGDPRLRVPRRQEPRTSVPSGSVGLAGEFSAVYPRASPGGWQLLGHTDAVLWDVDRDPPALLTTGMVVRFVDAERTGGS